MPTTTGNPGAKGYGMPITTGNLDAKGYGMPTTTGNLGAKGYGMPTTTGNPGAKGYKLTMNAAVGVIMTTCCKLQVDEELNINEKINDASQAA